MKKITILFFLSMFFGSGLMAQEFQPNWPVNGNRYIYFGSTSTLDQTQIGNYAMLQDKLDGTTFLNSPRAVSININNQNKMLINDDGVAFINGFANDWPANTGFMYFGTLTLDQTQNGNYALLQDKTNGDTFLNSPSSLFLRINNQNKLVINNNGNVGIGVNMPDTKLAVDGIIKGEEVNVEVVNGPDYVFESDYQLRTLREIKDYIAKNKHLPEIPSAKEMETHGVDLGDMNMRLLKKIEELTLYQIELLERLEQLELKNAEIEELKQALHRLKSQ